MSYESHQRQLKLAAMTEQERTKFLKREARKQWWSHEAVAYSLITLFCIGGLFGLVVEIARGVTWIKWAFK